jgi:hypothetical protein
MPSKLSAAGWAAVLAGAVVTSLSGSAPTTGPAAADRTDGQGAVTLPAALDHGRMTVEVEILRDDGTVRKAAAWVDTGNQTLNLAAPLARELGLNTSGLEDGGGRHSVASSSPAPPMRLGGLLLAGDDVPVRISPGARVVPGVAAEVQLPAALLRRLQVVFDYPGSRLTVARSASAEPRGTPVPCRVNPRTGLLCVTASLDGDAVVLGVDTGSAGTWVSDRLTSAWSSRHPTWPRTTGALGSANFFGFDFETAGALTRIPAMGIGPVTIRNVAVLGLDQSLFDWYSKKSAETVAGFIGANVLRRFRVAVDWPRQMTWWEPEPERDDRDLDIVGMTLRPEPDGTYTVAGVAVRGGRPAVAVVEAGDRLMRVGALEVTGATMGVVLDALRGAPGDTRTLVLDRQGRTVTVEATVTSFP